jgi:hypothetical protein
MAGHYFKMPGEAFSVVITSRVNISCRAQLFWTTKERYRRLTTS